MTLEDLYFWMACALAVAAIFIGWFVANYYSGEGE